MSNLVPAATHYSFKKYYSVSLNDKQNQTKDGQIYLGNDIPAFEKVDWEYDLRREMQEIIPGLYLGPYASAGTSKLDQLLSVGITYIVCIRHDSESQFINPKFPEKFKYLVLNIEDSPKENISQHFSTVRDFINESLGTGGKVLVHSNAGLSRCAALTMAYIMETYNISCKQAFSYVLARRYCINPNEGFMTQLMEYEPICKAMHMIKTGKFLPWKSVNKRSMDWAQDSEKNKTSPSTVPESEGMDTEKNRRLPSTVPESEGMDTQENKTYLQQTTLSSTVPVPESQVMDTD